MEDSRVDRASWSRALRGGGVGRVCFILLAASASVPPPKPLQLTNCQPSLPAPAPPRQPQRAERPTAAGVGGPHQPPAAAAGRQQTHGAASAGVGGVGVAQGPLAGGRRARGCGPARWAGPWRPAGRAGRCRSVRPDQQGLRGLTGRRGGETTEAQGQSGGVRADQPGLPGPRREGARRCAGAEACSAQTRRGLGECEASQPAAIGVLRSFESFLRVSCPRSRRCFVDLSGGASSNLPQRFSGGASSNLPQCLSACTRHPGTNSSGKAGFGEWAEKLAVLLIVFDPGGRSQRCANPSTACQAASPFCLFHTPAMPATYWTARRAVQRQPYCILPHPKPFLRGGPHTPRPGPLNDVDQSAIVASPFQQSLGTKQMC